MKTRMLCSICGNTLRADHAMYVGQTAGEPADYAHKGCLADPDGKGFGANTGAALTSFFRADKCLGESKPAVVSAPRACGDCSDTGLNCKGLYCMCDKGSAMFDALSAADKDAYRAARQAK